MAFETTDVYAVSGEEKQSIVRDQPSVIVSHSLPFPIALVEDQTNVVYTKALLFLHLFKSYASQCVNCPWCKRFLSISEFSKHIHLDEIDDDDDDDDDDEDEDETDDDDEDEKAENGSSDKAAKKLKAAEALKQRRREAKLAKLKQKAFKILPYCKKSSDGDEARSSGAGGLSESDIKTWKLFGDLFSSYKLKRKQQQQQQQQQQQTQKVVVESRPVSAPAPAPPQHRQTSSAAASSSDVGGKLNDGKGQHETAKQHQIQQQLSQQDSEPGDSDEHEQGRELDDDDEWDYACKEKNVFVMAKANLEHEAVAYVSRVESPEQQAPTSTTTSTKTTTTTSNVALASKHSPERRKAMHDLSLSEDEEEEDDDKQETNEGNLYSSSSSSLLSDENDKDKTTPASLGVLAPKRRGRAPTLAQLYANLYDNQPLQVMRFIERSDLIVAPLSFLAYRHSQRCELTMSYAGPIDDTIAATTPCATRLIWLSHALDLETNATLTHTITTKN